MVRENIMVTLRRLRSYESQGWKVLIDIFHTNMFFELNKINEIWLNKKWFSIISVDEERRVIYAIPLKGD